MDPRALDMLTSYTLLTLRAASGGPTHLWLCLLPPQSQKETTAPHSYRMQFLYSTNRVCRELDLITTLAPHLQFPILKYKILVCLEGTQQISGE